MAVAGAAVRLADAVRSSTDRIPHSHRARIHARNLILPILALVGALGCGSDSGTGVPKFAYTIQPAAATVAIGQDSTAPLGIPVMRCTDDAIRCRAAPLVLLGRLPDRDGRQHRVVTAISGGNATNIAFASARHHQRR